MGLRRRPKDNLNTKERVALDGLQEKVRGKEWAVRPADKGGGITVEKYESIKEDGFQELTDETTFEKREKSGLAAISKEVEEKLKDMRDRGVITQKMREHMSAKKQERGGDEDKQESAQEGKGEWQTPNKSIHIGDRDADGRNSRTCRSRAARGSGSTKIIHSRHSRFFKNDGRGAEDRGK